MQFPTMTAAAAAGKISSFMLFGIIPVPVFNYAGTVIPIILSIWLLSYIWRFVDKHLPDAMRTVFTPTISLFIGGIIALTVVGPLGIYGGNWLADGVRWLFSVSSIFAGIVVGAIRPIAVMTGLHHAMTPIALQNFANQGYAAPPPGNAGLHDLRAVHARRAARLLEKPNWPVVAYDVQHPGGNHPGDNIVHHDPHPAVDIAVEPADLIISAYRQLAGVSSAGWITCREND